MKTKTSFLCSFIIAGICCMQSLKISCNGARINSQLTVNPKPAFKVNAVNVGGWLVTEGWMTPSLFDDIPNNDLLIIGKDSALLTRSWVAFHLAPYRIEGFPTAVGLPIFLSVNSDGTQIQLKSVKIGKYLSAEHDGGTISVANSTSASVRETFTLWRINETTFNFRVFGNQFAGLQMHNTSSPAVVAKANLPGAVETFQIVRKSDNASRVRIRAPNGHFLQAKTQDLVTADYAGDGGWGDDNPSVFVMSVVASLQGEYQVTNGYGPEKAPQVMKEHRSTFIVEDDFRFISENGINAVRIPVGWWIASDPTPPKPFVGGSLEALDNAFSWAQKYDIQVIIDLHAAPGSQNGNPHSASRDGSIDWGKTNDTIQQTVAAIDFLASRYANNSKLYAVELLNEPHAYKNSENYDLETLKHYYQLGYEAVRKHSSSAYVIMSNRLGTLDARELLPLASGLKLTVIDLHYYNLFADNFNNMTVQQNIDHVNNVQSSELNHVTTSDGPLTFVGEWVSEWKVKGATKEDYHKFSNAQLKVFDHASFGWAYWSLKSLDNHWNLKWMIQNGYITLTT